MNQTGNSQIQLNNLPANYDLYVYDTAGSSSLSYDAAADRYVYVWKTDKAWADTCRTLVLKLNDGTYHLEESGSPQIHLTSLPANYDLYVHNSAGQLMGQSAKDKKAAEMVKLTNAMPGNYYVRIVGINRVWDANNSYQLRFNVPGIGGP